MPYPTYQMPYQMAYNPYPLTQFYPSQSMPTQQNIPQVAPQPVQQQPAQQMQPQLQNGGFMSVRSLDEAVNWPIAPGVGMTFKVENAPVICTKSRGFSPLEEPVLKIYDMIERVPQQATANAPLSAEKPAEGPSIEYAERSYVDDIRRELEAFKAEFKADLQALKDQPLAVEIKRPSAKTKKEVEE